MIRVEGLVKRFGAVTAVDGISFAADDGAITGLLGPNGAGKTTTLRILYGVMRPDEGIVRIDDVDAATAPLDAQARIGVLPDEFGLYQRLTAREHVRYFGELHGVSGKRLETRTRELFARLDMEGIADRRVSGFSHGERTKVAVARALVHDPRTILLDEPTNGLDVMSTRALLGPVLLTILMNQLAGRQREAEDVRIPVVGIDAAPALVDWLRQQRGVEVVEGPDDPEAAVRNRDEAVIVVIDADFAERFRASRPARVEIVADSARVGSSQQIVDRVRQLLQAYSSEVGTLRLVARGVSPAAAMPLDIRELDVSSAQQRAAQILAFIPLLIIVAAFSGGMAVAIDATAGERERRSLEPLLVNPVPRSAVVTGKWLATAAAAAAAVVLTMAACMALPRFLPLQEMGVRFRFGPESAGPVLAAALPLCLLLSALQIWVATFARSTKEAQSYLGFLMVLPVLPALMASVMPQTGQWWMFALPMIGPQALLTDLLAGRSPGVWAFASAAAASIAVAMVFVRLTTRLFHDERIVFGR